jgi:hypothetical protein
LPVFVSRHDRPRVSPWCGESELESFRERCAVVFTVDGADELRNGLGEQINGGPVTPRVFTQHNTAVQRLDCHHCLVVRMWGRSTHFEITRFRLEAAAPFLVASEARLNYVFDGDGPVEDLERLVGGLGDFEERFGGIL